MTADPYYAKAQERIEKELCDASAELLRADEESTLATVAYMAAGETYWKLALVDVDATPTAEEDAAYAALEAARNADARAEARHLQAQRRFLKAERMDVVREAARLREQDEKFAPMKARREAARKEGQHA